MRSTKEIIENLVSDYLKNHDIKNNSRILSAYSGGPDSTVLLTILKELPGYALEITAAYFNHGLRDEAELKAEVEHVRRQAERLGIELVIGFEETGKIRKTAAESGLSIEEAARNARYAFLYRTAEQLHAHYIATGHNINDNTETMIMRFMQNSGPAGLAGIPPKRNNIIRPLLKVNREIIDCFLKEEKITYSIDKTNFEDDYLRNKLRQDIIPAVKKIFQDIDANMMGLSDKMKLQNDFIDSEAEKRLIWEKTTGGWRISAVDFYQEPLLLRIKSIFRILNLVSSVPRINYRSVLQAADGFVHENGKMLLRNSDTEVFTGNGYIFIERLVNHEKKSYLLNMETGVKVFVSGQNFMMKDADNCCAFDGTDDEHLLRIKSGSPLIVRSCREGDCIETDSGRKSLKKLYNEWKVRSEDKYRVAVVEDTSHIAAVIGKHLGYNNKTAVFMSENDSELKKILLIINSDTETTCER